MKCETVHQYLPLYLDSELSAETNLMIVRHLESCAVCHDRMAQEERVEKALQGVLSRISVDQEAVWQKALHTWVRPRRRLLRRRVLVVAISVLVMVASWLVFSPGQADLAVAMATAHKKYLAGTLTPVIDTDDLDRLTTYFKSKQIFRTDLGSVPINLSLLGGRCCYLGQSACIFLMGQVDHKAVSFFAMDSSQMSDFPMAARRLQAGAFHCQVGGFHAFVFMDKERIVCAIGEIPSASLEILSRQLMVPTPS